MAIREYDDADKDSHSCHDLHRWGDDIVENVIHDKSSKREREFKNSSQCCRDISEATKIDASSEDIRDEYEEYDIDRTFYHFIEEGSGVYHFIW